MPTKEYRWFRASVRQDNAIGAYSYKVFQLHVTVTCSHSAMMLEAITLLRSLGYATNHIASHSLRKECL